MAISAVAPLTVLPWQSQQVGTCSWSERLAVHLQGVVGTLLEHVGGWVENLSIGDEAEDSRWAVSNGRRIAI